MAKKKSFKKCTKWLLFATVVLAIATFVMMFLNAVVCKVENGDDVYKVGTDITFGKALVSASLGSLASGSTKIDFSFGLMVAYLLPLVLTVVLAIVAFLTKKKNVKKLLGILVACSFIASLILFINVCNISTITASQTNSITGPSSTTKTLSDLGYTMAYGTIIAIVTSSLGILTSLAYSVTE